MAIMSDCTSVCINQLSMHINKKARLQKYAHATNNLMWLKKEIWQLKSMQLELMVMCEDAKNVVSHVLEGMQHEMQAQLKLLGNKMPSMCTTQGPLLVPL
jgi:hypothetical protein